MSTVQILPATAPAVHQTSSWPLISNILSAFSRAHYTPTSKIPVNNVEEEPKDLFPDLPPLLHGHPDVHLREGVMNASRAAASGVPDAEKAFFVADLSRVYQQHLRWQRCLPGVEPFYGELSSDHLTIFWSDR
jgi:ornithine decarboxylase